MTSILQAATGQLSETKAVVAGGGDMYDTAGVATGEYNSNSGDADGTGTFLKTNLGSVSEAEVSISTTDQAIGTADTGLVIGESRPAVPGDFVNDEDYVDGTVIFTLLDGADGTEIAAGTAIDGNSLEFEVQVSHT